MSIWEAAILGLLQGLTEFLPVSSSGHLVLGEHLLGIDATSGGLTFEVFLHFGTVMSVATVYWLEVKSIACSSVMTPLRTRSLRRSLAEDPHFRTAYYIFLTMIPTGIVFLLFKDPLEQAFSDPRLVCGMLLVTGTVLLLTMLRKTNDRSMTGWKALLTGCAQGFALIPGISRSGSTIATMLYTGIKRDEAANFSFLMSFPVIIAATLLHAIDAIRSPNGIVWLPVIVGTLVAYGSGIWAIRVVINFVRKGRIQWFAAWCFLVGILGLIFLK